MTSHWSIFGRPNYLLEELHWEPKLFVVCLTLHFLSSKANWWFGCCLFFVFVLVCVFWFVCVCFVWLFVAFVCVYIGLTIPRPWVPKYGTFYCIHNDCHYRHDERSMGSKKWFHRTSSCTLESPESFWLDTRNHTSSLTPSCTVSPGLCSRCRESLSSDDRTISPTQGPWLSKDTSPAPACGSCGSQTNGTSSCSPYLGMRCVFVYATKYSLLQGVELCRMSFTGNSSQSTRICPASIGNLLPKGDSLNFMLLHSCASCWAGTRGGRVRDPLHQTKGNAPLYWCSRSCIAFVTISAQ